MIKKLTDAQREALQGFDARDPESAAWLGAGRGALRIIDQQAEALAAAEARIAAATEILLGSSGHLASEALAALRGQR